MRMIILCGLLATLCLAADAQARRWTDKQGRTMDAEFLRVSGKTVFFDRNGEELGVEMSDLSDRDQRFIRRLLRTQQGKNGKKRASRTSKKITNRVWTDDQGNRTEAKFVRVHNDNVVLIRGGRTISLPFWKLSKGDQQYVAGILKDLGQETPPAEKPAPAKPAGQNAPLGGGTAGGGMPAGRGGMPAGGRFAGGGMSGGFPRGGMRGGGMRGGGLAGRGGSPFGRGSIPGQGGNLGQSARERVQKSIDESRARMNEQRRQMDQRMAEIKRSSQGNSKAESEAGRMLDRMNKTGSRDNLENSLSKQIEDSNRIANEAMNAAQASVDDLVGDAAKNNASTVAAQSSRQATIPSFQSDKSCGSCGRSVAANLAAGDSCPHCGAYFSYEEDAVGNRKWANGRGWMLGGGIAGVVAIIGVMLRMIIAWARS